MFLSQTDEVLPFWIRVEQVGWLGFMAYQPLMGYFMPNPVYVFIYQIYMNCKCMICSLTFLDKPELTCLHMVILEAILAKTSSSIEC